MVLNVNKSAANDSVNFSPDSEENNVAFNQYS